MSQQAFNLDEFIDKSQPPPPAAAEANSPEPEAEAEEQPLELDVQKAVVEELAAEKLELHEKITAQETEIAAQGAKITAQETEIAALKAENGRLAAEVSALQAKINLRLAHELDQQERNPNALALLDRDVELPDRFPGETRDHVLEVVKAARDEAEKEGRLRRAQLLESVLVANEPGGMLASRREELKKLFAENGNIVNGPVLTRLQELGIPHKNGEEYLLPSEIIKRAF